MDVLNEVLERVEHLLLNIQRKRPWLAKKAGISLNTINGWYSRNSFPNVYDAHKIAICLRVSIEYLITGKEGDIDPENKNLNPKAKEIIEFVKSLDNEGLAGLRIAIQFWNSAKISPLIPILDMGKESNQGNSSKKVKETS